MDYMVLLSVHQLVCFLGTFSEITIIYLHFFYVDFNHIKGLPEIPGGSWISGHLYMLQNDHASTAESLATSVMASLPAQVWKPKSHNAQLV
jgi:hypothetical protein